METFSQDWRLKSKPRQKQGCSPPRPLSSAGHRLPMSSHRLTSVPVCLNFLFSYESNSPTGSGPSLMTLLDLNYLLLAFHMQAYSEAGEFRNAACDFGGSGVRMEWGTGGHNLTHNGCVSLVVSRLILERLFLHKEFSQQLFFLTEENEGCEMVGRIAG